MADQEISSNKVFNTNIKTYDLDGRLPIETLWAKYDKLVTSGLFDKELIYQMNGQDSEGKTVSVPTYAYKSKITGSSIWIFAGIHGEEPAGSQAVADEVDNLVQMAKSGTPMVIVPLANGLGYVKDWRYQNKPRAEDHRNEGHSVGDMDHLTGINNEASNKYAKIMGEWILKTVMDYPPVILVNLHEDELEPDSGKAHPESSYSFSCGSNSELLDNYAKKICEILKKRGFPLVETGYTDRDEKIINGFIKNIHDGSIDELLTNFGLVIGFIIETTRSDKDGKTYQLNNRVDTHREILKLLPEMWQKVMEQSSN
jgi:hypothetical protein